MKQWIVLVPFDQDSDGLIRYEARGGFFLSKKLAREYAVREWAKALVVRIRENSLSEDQRDLIQAQERES
jgi:hypothetical protein